MLDREKRGFFVLSSKVKRQKANIILLWVALLGASCGGLNKEGNDAAPTPVAQVPMRVVTDDLGRQVTIPVTINRVVSTAPSVTENIFAVGAGDRLVGVTTFCNYPEEAKSIVKIGDTMTPNMENIVALKPEIVFVSTASQIEAFTKTLELNGIAVYVTSPKSLDDVFVELDKFVELFRTWDKVSVNSWRSRENQVWTSVKDSRFPKVFIQISKEPLFTIGRDSFINSLIFKAGGESVTEKIESAYPKLSKETASTLNPEVIVLSDSEDNQGPNDAFKNSPAVRNGRVYKVNADILSRPGPRLVDALEQIAKDLHPEKFK